MDLIPHKGQGETGKVTAATGTTDNHIGIFTDQLHLLLGLLSYDRLMQENVIQNTAQGIAGIFITHHIFNGLADGDTQTTGGIGIFRKEFSPYFSAVAGAGKTLGPPR